MTDQYIPHCAACNKAMGDYVFDELCNGCVQSGTIQCRDCCTMPKTTACKGCTYAVGPCHSMNLDVLTVQGDSLVSREAVAVCDWTHCMHMALDALYAVDPVAGREVCLSLTSINMIKQYEEQERRKRSE